MKQLAQFELQSNVSETKIFDFRSEQQSLKRRAKPIFMSGALTMCIYLLRQGTQQGFYQIKVHLSRKKWTPIFGDGLLIHGSRIIVYYKFFLIVKHGIIGDKLEYTQDDQVLFLRFVMLSESEKFSLNGQKIFTELAILC